MAQICLIVSKHIIRCRILKQIVDCLIDTKVMQWLSSILLETVKYLKIDIVESYAPDTWLARAHSLSGLYGNHKITYKKKENKMNNKKLKS